jgi:guanine deaminase
MLGDDLEPYVNYVPLARDAKGRNEAICGPAGHAPGCADCGGLCTNGAFRTEKGERDPAKTEANLALWREAAEKFHDPVNGINIVVGPVTAYSASTELLRGAAEIRKEFGLCGHIHLLETRAQALMARQFLPSGSAVKHLRDTGFLQVPGTTCGHCVWLDDEEVAIMAECEATAVHNPFSNLRLGSGVAPLFSYAQRGMNVCLGADGACSSDGQDMLEVAKLANILPCVATPEYRDWPTAHYTAMRLGAANGYKGILLEGKPGQLGKGGVLEEGALADVSLWDLTSLSMLPRTDPLSLLIQGSRTQAPGAGSALDSAWVNGTRVVKNGSPVNVDVIALREVLRHAQGEYRDPAITDPSTHDKTARAEKEYRAAMDLDPAGAVGDRPHYEWPEHCTLYEASQR